MASCEEAEQGEWAGLPEELLLTVLEQLEWERRESAAVRLTCSRWSRVHDNSCPRLKVHGRATDEMMEELCAKMPALTELDLWGSESLTDDGLVAVAELTSLSVLWLNGCSKVTDEGMTVVAEMSSLVCLGLGACDKVTAHGLQSVAQLTELMQLDLDWCSGMTDEGVRAVAELPSLTYLNLARTSVTNVGLQHLSGLEQLSELNLTCCDTSEAAEKELCRQIPGLEIVREDSDEDGDEQELSDEEPGQWEVYDEEEGWLLW